MPSRASERGAVAVGDDRVVTLELDTPAVVECIDRVQDLVGELIAATSDDLDFTDRMRFETALVEIVGNIVEHGVAAVGQLVTMHVSVQRSECGLQAVVLDDGVAVDIDLENAVMSGDDHEHGRGLAMARAVATELRYERDGDRNRWTIRCERSS